LKYLLEVGDEYKYLLNEEDDDKSNGMLVIEINPKDQDFSMIKFQTKVTKLELLVHG
jgi:hypothetical protein